MKVDANDIARTEGVDALRLAIDNGIRNPQSSKKSAESNTRFQPIAIDDVRASGEPAWLISRLLPARGLACVVGPPKSGKSFLTTDALFAVARGVPYAGRDTLQGPVIYLTGEGQSGFKRRLVAMRRHYGVEGHGVPFYAVERVPDLGSEKTQDVQVLVTELAEYIRANGMAPPRAIVLDTLARCMGEGDENTARDMGRFVNRCGEIERSFGCLVVAVHHMGKDSSRGARGSNALNGAADATWTVEKTEAYSRVTVDELKDGPEGAEWRFRLEQVDLTETFAPPSETSPKHASEGTTCVVEIVSEPAGAKRRETFVRKLPSGVSGDLLKIIKHALHEAGQQGATPAAPGAIAVNKATLKAYCKTMDWQQERDNDGFRSVFSRTLSGLRATNHVGFDQEHVWIT